MKILQINATYASGSTGTIVKDIQQCCEANGIECYVAYSKSHLPVSQIRNGYKIGNLFSNKLHALLCRVNGQQAYFSYFSTRFFLRYMDRLKPDVVHLHNLHANYINLNMLLRYLAKLDIPTVVTLHDCWFYTGGCFHYTNAQCSKWLESCGNCPKKHQDTRVYFLDKSAQILKDRYNNFGRIKNLTVVGVSKWITQEATKTVFRNAKSATIYNGVDTNIFKPTPSDLRKQYDIEDKYVVLGPASKWLATVNKGVFQTVVDGLDDDTVLFLFGCPSSLPTLPANVKTCGFTRNKEELAKIYSMADVFVNCTREDTLPTINLEAQACGTPVITFDNTGASETVDGENGLRIKTGDSIALLNAILKQRRKKCLKKEEIIKWVKEHFEKISNYQQYIHLYECYKQ